MNSYGYVLLDFHDKCFPRFHDVSWSVWSVTSYDVSRLTPPPHNFQFSGDSETSRLFCYDSPEFRAPWHQSGKSWVAWTRAAWRKKHGAGPWTWSFGGSGEGVLVGTYGLILPAYFRAIPGQQIQVELAGDVECTCCAAFFNRRCFSSGGSSVTSVSS